MAYNSPHHKTYKKSRDELTGFFVYVLARTKSPKIHDALIGFYSEIRKESRGGSITGLKSIDPVMPGPTLDDLMMGKPQKLVDAVYDAPLEGIAIFSEWESGEAIDEFYRGELHRMLTDYAFKEAGSTVLTVVQYRNGAVTRRDIKGRVE